MSVLFGSNLENSVVPESRDGDGTPSAFKFQNVTLNFGPLF